MWFSPSPPPSSKISQCLPLPAPQALDVFCHYFYCDEVCGHLCSVPCPGALPCPPPPSVPFSAFCCRFFIPAEGVPGLPVRRKCLRVWLNGSFWCSRSEVGPRVFISNKIPYKVRVAAQEPHFDSQVLTCFVHFSVSQIPSSPTPDLAFTALWCCVPWMAAFLTAPASTCLLVCMGGGVSNLPGFKIPRWPKVVLLRIVDPASGSSGIEHCCGQLRLTVN